MPDIKTFERTFIFRDFLADKPFAAFLVSEEAKSESSLDISDKDRIFIASGKSMFDIDKKDNSKDLIVYNNPIGVCSAYPIKSMRTTSFVKDEDNNDFGARCIYEGNQEKSFWYYNKLVWITPTETNHIECLIIRIEFYNTLGGLPDENN